MSLIIFYEIKFLRKNCRDVHVTVMLVTARYGELSNPQVQPHGQEVNNSVLLLPVV